MADGDAVGSEGAVNEPEDEVSMAQFFTDKLQLLRVTNGIGNLRVAGNLLEREDLNRVMLDNEELLNKQRDLLRLDDDVEEELPTVEHSETASAAATTTEPDNPGTMMMRPANDPLAVLDRVNAMLVQTYGRKKAEEIDRLSKQMTAASQSAVESQPPSLMNTVEANSAAVVTTPAEAIAQSTVAPEGSSSPNSATEPMTEEQVPEIRIRTDIFEDPGSPAAANTEPELESTGAEAAPVNNSQFEMNKAIIATQKAFNTLAADFRTKVKELRAQPNVPLKDQFEILQTAQAMIFRTFEAVDTTKLALSMSVPELDAPVFLLRDEPETKVEDLATYFEILFEATTLSKRPTVSAKTRAVLVVTITRILRILGYFMVKNKSPKQSDTLFTNVSAMVVTRLAKYFKDTNDIALLLIQLWGSVRSIAAGSYEAVKLDHVNLGPVILKARVDKLKASWEKSQRAAAQVPGTSPSAMATAVPQAQQMRPQFIGIGPQIVPQPPGVNPNIGYLRQPFGGPPPPLPQFSHEQKFRAILPQPQQYQPNNASLAHPGNNAAGFSGGSVSQVRPQPPQYQRLPQMQQYAPWQIGQQYIRVNPPPPRVQMQTPNANLIPLNPQQQAQLFQQLHYYQQQRASFRPQGIPPNPEDILNRRDLN